MNTSNSIVDITEDFKQEYELADKATYDGWV